MDAEKADHRCRGRIRAGGGHGTRIGMRHDRCEQGCVITSYSIHYTKLYDCLLDGNHRFMQMLGFAGLQLIRGDIAGNLLLIHLINGFRE